MQVAWTPAGVLATPGLVVSILEYGLPMLNLARDLVRARAFWIRASSHGMVALLDIGGGLDLDVTRYVPERYRANGGPVVLVHPTTYMA
jgi:hypothetical protein